MRISLQWTPVPGKKLIGAALDDALTASAKVYADTMVESFGRTHGGVPSARGGFPHSQTGRLRASIAYVSPASAGTPGTALVGTEVPYGRFLHTGATITPKRVKAIPVPLNRRAAKMLEKASLSGGLRSQKLKVVRDKKGNTYLFETTPTGREKTNGARFVLKKRVVIKARPWITLPGRVPAARMQAAALQAATARMGASQ